MEADRLRPRRLPEDVVLKDAHAAVAHQPRGQPSDPLRQHLRGDDGVGLPCVAELARPVIRVAARDPVHLVGPDAGLVLAVEEAEVPLAQEPERGGWHEAVLDEQEAVPPERLDLLGGERLDHRRAGRVLSGS